MAAVGLVAPKGGCEGSMIQYHTGQLLYSGPNSIDSRVIILYLLDLFICFLFIYIFDYISIFIYCFIIYLM